MYYIWIFLFSFFTVIPTLKHYGAMQTNSQHKHAIYEINNILHVMYNCKRVVNIAILVLLPVVLAIICEYWCKYRRSFSHAVSIWISAIDAIVKSANNSNITVAERVTSSAIAERPRCSLFKLWQKYKCEKRASNIAQGYGVDVNESSFYCSTVPCLYLMQN